MQSSLTQRTRPSAIKSTAKSSLAEQDDGLNGRTGQALASSLLAVSAFIIALKLLQPASVGIYVGSAGNAILIGTAPGLYTFDDVLVVFAASLVAGASTTVLLLPWTKESSPTFSEAILNDRKVKWTEVSRTLKDDQVKVYQAILDVGGLVSQRELVEKTTLSKATVSRALDLLESRGLVEKRRRGMSNMILLK
ncbi:MarR family transcriptional regulator [Candidatus Bathyarchaeota archaeon]|nr:MAG: MarR family transcriptional regulator [Candidatus Bathyarchaeota archaeon]TMI68012.1 MAG: MarR family transcriptional regulator [Candidatus Bathyarchaeota archaeon]